MIGLWDCNCFQMSWSSEIGSGRVLGERRISRCEEITGLITYKLRSVAWKEALLAVGSRNVLQFVDGTPGSTEPS